jgi:DNA polymerase-3 subunit delta
MTKAAQGKAASGEGTDARKKSVHLVWGDDDYLVLAQARRIIEALCPPDQQALGLEQVDGAVPTVDEAVAAIEKCIGGLRTIGFFGSGKVIWLRNAALLSTEEKPGNSETVKEAVARLTEEIKAGLMEGQYLVITAAKLDRRTSFYKTCKEKAAVHEFVMPEKSREAEEHVRGTVGELFAAAGLTARADALDAFVARTGADSRQIRQEIEKLRAYVGDRKQVTADDVRLMVAATRDAAGWDLADAFGKRDLRGALVILRRLLFQRESPMGLIAGLESRVRDMIVFRECLDRRWLRISTGYRRNAEWSSSPEMESTFGALPADPRKGHPYRQLVLAEQAMKFTLAELVRIQREVVDTHERLKSAPIDDAVQMELLLVKCLGRAGVG